jgi:hypothetical protein
MENVEPEGGVTVTMSLALVPLTIGPGKLTTAEQMLGSFETVTSAGQVRLTWALTVVANVMSNASTETRVSWPTPGVIDASVTERMGYLSYCWDTVYFVSLAISELLGT